jgi:predicted dienelactone hydrolase
MVQHPGSDAAIFRESRADPFWAVMRAALRKRNWTDRPGDLRRVLDEIAAPEGGESHLRRAAPGLRFNTEAVGVAGHSFGAYAALALVGLRVDFPGSGARAFGDSRVRAVVQMSFPGDMGGALGADAFEGIRVPCLHFSGTRDDTPMLASWADDRRIPFDRIPGPHQYLVTFAGADHFALADNEIGLDGRPILRNPAVHQFALAITTTFWDAFLRGDADARERLRRADLAALSLGLCALERRNLPAE